MTWAGVLRRWGRWTSIDCTRGGMGPEEEGEGRPCRGQSAESSGQKKMWTCSPKDQKSLLPHFTASCPYPNTHTHALTHTQCTHTHMHTMHTMHTCTHAHNAHMHTHTQEENRCVWSGRVACLSELLVRRACRPTYCPPSLLLVANPVPTTNYREGGPIQAWPIRVPHPDPGAVIGSEMGM